MPRTPREHAHRPGPPQGPCSTGTKPQRPGPAHGNSGEPVTVPPPTGRAPCDWLGGCRGPELSSWGLTLVSHGRHRQECPAATVTFLSPGTSLLHLRVHGGSPTNDPRLGLWSAGLCQSTVHDPERPAWMASGRDRRGGECRARAWITDKECLSASKHRNSSCPT